MPARGWLEDAVIGVVSGSIGTRVMTAVTTRIYALTPESVKEQEKRVSPGVSYNVAAGQLAARVGLHLSEEQQERVGSAFHDGLGLAAGELYVFLRRLTPLGPVPSALVTAMTLFLGIDEGLTPLMGWSAPDSAYPLATHLRGFLGHLSLGAGVAATAEFLFRLFDAPRR